MSPQGLKEKDFGYSNQCQDILPPKHRVHLNHTHIHSYNHLANEHILHPNVILPSQLPS